MCPKNPLKARLDVVLVNRGLAETREQAKRLILSGAVEIAGNHLPKPGQLIDTDAEIKMKMKEKYVSRGGLKLEAALAGFGINVRGKICADIGASTGGFTDCMLQHGAKEVFAVDVGATQMHEKVRSNPHVKLMEHTNARNLTPDQFESPPEFAAVDVSFISILRVTEPLMNVMAPGSPAVFLIKPQFEAGREAVTKGRGVIRDPEIHRTVLANVLVELTNQKWRIKGLIPSPIAGGSGNLEFLCHAETPAPNCGLLEMHIDIDEVVRSARATLK